MPPKMRKAIAPAAGLVSDSARGLAEAAADRERAFQEWYAQMAQRTGIDANPDAPEHKYDYRAAYRAGDGPDQTGHWPSRWKADDHPRRYLPIGPGGRMVDTKRQR